MDIISGEEVERVRIGGAADRALSRQAAGEGVVWGNLYAAQASSTPLNGRYVDGVFTPYFQFGVTGAGFEDAGLG